MSIVLKSFGVDCFRSIDDLPIYNWNKVIEEKNVKYLLKGRIKLSKDINAILQKKWRKLYDEYIKHFGFGERFMKIIELEKETALLQIEKIETDNTFLETFILINKSKLEHLKKKSKKQCNFYEAKSIIEKRLGFRIDAKTTTVIEYYSYLKQLQEQN